MHTSRLHRLVKHRYEYLAMLFIALWLLLAIGAPWIAPYPLSEIVGSSWEPPSWQAWLGTDNLGRDLLSRLIWGARNTIGMAFVATALAFILGGTSGLIAGIYGGYFDKITSWLNNVLLSIPTLVFALLVLAVIPTGLVTLCLLVAVLESLRIFRVARALAAECAHLDYVIVARMRGESCWWIIFKEVMPNIRIPLLAEFGLRLVFSMLLIASLSFLGLGLQPPATDWGSITKDNRDGIMFGVWAALVPGAAIALLALSMNVLVERISRRHIEKVRGEHQQ